MSNYPYQNPSKPEGQTVRRPRSQRAAQGAPGFYQPKVRPAYPADEERAPLPLGSVPEQPAAPRRERPSSYDYEAAPPRQAYDDDPGDDDAPRLWPKLLALLLGMALLIAAGLYFMVPEDSAGILGTARGAVAKVVDGALGLIGVRDAKAPVLIKFETPAQESVTGMKTVFTFTADSAIDGVRVVDDQGSEIKGQLAAADPGRTVWTLSVVFDQPMSGSLRADMLRGDTWYPGDKRISFSVLAPTPEPTAQTQSLTIFSPLPVDANQAALAATAAAEPFAMMVSEQTPGPATAEPFVVAPATLLPQAPQTPGQAAPVTIITIAPLIQPTAEPAGENPADIMAEEVLPEEDVSDMLVGAEDWAAAGGFTLPLEEAGQPAVQEATELPQATAAPQPEATPAPSAMPTLTAAADESAAPGKLKIVDAVYTGGKKTAELARALPLDMPAPYQYATYEGGVFTFRGDSFRGNAATGAPDMPLKQLSVLWKAPLGSLRTGDGTLYGLGWTGQPAIIRWSKELREWMNIVPAKKDVTALKEVIAASLDGKIYFFDLNDGVPTREPIDLGYPMKGSVSIDPRGQPLLAVGQGISKLANKTGPIGYYLYELIGQKELFFLNGRKTKAQTQFSTNGAFDGTALFERSSDSLVLSGENGLLYTLALNTKFDYLDTRTLKVDPVVTYLKSKGSQDDMSVSSEASVAMYGKYIYTVDRQGILRCVDSGSMTTVWAFDTGDNTDATPALGFDDDGSLGLYTGTTVFTRLRRDGNALIRRVDAITGKEIWKVAVPAKYDQTERAGVKASPVVGEGSVKDLVFFTVNMTNDGAAATLLALDKATGAQVWRHELAAPAVSSPVAVYSKAGDAFIIQADEKGLLSLLNARTGEELSTLDLAGKIEGSPAVYNDVLVIGTTDKDNNFLYGIRLE